MVIVVASCGQIQFSTCMKYSKFIFVTSKAILAKVFDMIGIYSQ